MTRAINAFLHSNYTLEQVRGMPSDQLDLLDWLLQAQQGEIIYDAADD